MNTIYSKHNPEKKWPIIPDQLITDRADCPWCHLRDHEIANNSEKCSCCGVVTEEHLRGILYCIYEKLEIPIVLFERVRCPAFQIEALKGDEKNAYHSVGKEIYHQIDAANLYTKDTFCFQCRNNKDFSEKCLESDLKAVQKIYAMFDHGSIELDSVQIKDAKGDAQTVQYYRYSCETTNLIELAFPILVGNMLVAVAIVGQIVLDNTMEDICESCWNGSMQLNGIPCFQYYLEKKNPNLPLIKNKKVSRIHTIVKSASSLRQFANERGYDADLIMNTIRNQFEKLKFPSMDHALEKIGKVIFDFQFRMEERFKIRSSDFLYTKQGQYLAALTDSANVTQHGTLLLKKINSIFASIKEDFFIEKLYMFLPQDHAPKAPQQEYVGKEIGGDGPDLVLPIFQLPLGLIDNHKMDVGKFLALLRGDVSTVDPDKSDCFIHFEEIENNLVAEERCGIAILIQWDKAPNTSQYDSFFNVIVDTCFALIMTQVARRKQNSISVFRETTRHDLSQQLGIINQHCQTFKENLAKYDVYEMSRTAFLRAAGDFQKEVMRVERSLTHITDTLEDEILRDQFLPKSFLLYGNVIFNLKERYNNMQYEKIQLNITLPRDDAEGMQFPEIYADPHLIERMLSNLINNAFKYAFSYSKVYLCAYYMVHEKNYVFEVINFGAQITPEDTEKIFEYGFRSEHSKDPGGRGIGLYNVRRFAQMHGGDVTVSRNEQVSAFNIPAMHRFEKMVNEKHYRELLPQDRDALSAFQEVKKKLMSEESDLFDDRLLITNQSDNYYDTIVLDAPLTDNDSLRNLRRQLHNPTYCIAFKIIIPQEEKEG